MVAVETPAPVAVSAEDRAAEILAAGAIAVAAAGAAADAAAPSGSRNR